MGAVGVGGVDFAEEGDAAHHVAVGVGAAGAAMDEGEGEASGGGAEQDDGGDGEAFVDFAGEGGVAAAGVSVVGELDGGEEEAAGVAGVGFVVGVVGGQ